MNITYVCRHCRTIMGEITNATIGEAHLGLDRLTAEERSEILSYDSGGDLSVRLVCDYCTEALAANPELSLVNNPLQ